jgi:cytochrome c peroxidase
MHWLLASALLPLLLQTARADEPITPLPLTAPIANVEKVLLGKRLFHDTKLSKSETVSCASCHNLQAGGDDGRTRSLGINGAQGDVNAPTVFNGVYNFRQFWNGRARNLNEQIDGPVQNAKEMGSTWDEVVLKVKLTYADEFAKVYKAEPTRENIKDAIVAFEQTLITPNAPLDRYLRGEKEALNEKEKQGYALFKSYGCVACHQGVNVGGNMFQTMGVMSDYFRDRGGPITEADMGRYAVTKAAADRHVFRVPSLRNVELTAPYFHDGSAKTLEEAVRVMAKYQLGRTLSKEDVDHLVAFLKTLTGELPSTVRDAAGKAGP